MESLKRIFLFLLILFLFNQPTAAKTIKIDMGEFKITFYCPCEECSKGYGRQTSSGKTACSEHTIAVDPKIIDIGSKVLIYGKVYTAEDTGEKVKGDHIDIFVDCHEETEEKGVKYTQVKVLKKKKDK